MERSEILIKSLVTLQNVSKSYGDKIILDNINLEIIKGETLAIIGDNGTGKSTLLKLIAGLSRASSGKRILYDNSSKLKIGYVPDRFPKLKFTPYEYMYYMGRLENLSKKYIDEFSNRLFKIFNIDSMKNTRIKYLSKGTIQKVAVIQAFMSKPDILLLDEPLSGQDNNSQKIFIDILQKFKLEKVCIVMACHEMYLVDKLADKVITIKDGKIELNTQGKYNNNQNMVIYFKNDKEINTNTIRDFKGVLNIIQKNQLFRILVEKNYSDAVILKLLQMSFSIVSVNEN